MIMHYIMMLLLVAICFLLGITWFHYYLKGSIWGFIKDSCLVFTVSKKSDVPYTICINPILCAFIHWLISFMSDKLVFQNVSMGKKWLAYKICFLVICIGIWKLLFYTINGIIHKDSYIIKAFQFFLGYFLLCTVIMICIWPGNWVWDDINIFKDAVKMIVLAWQHTLSSFIYIFSLMLIPIPAGVVFVQYIIISIVFGWIQGYIYQNLQQKRYIVLTILPFLLPPVLAHVFYPIRLTIYSFIGLFFFILLKRLAIEKTISPINMLVLAATLALLISWRSEGILYIAAAPLCLLLSFRDYKKICWIISTAFCTGLLLISIQNHFIGHEKEYYSITAYTYPLNDLIKYEYQTNPKSEILKDLDEKVDLQIILESENGDIAFWTGAYKKLISSREYDTVRADFIKLVLRHPMVCIRERIDNFLTTSGMTSRSRPFIGYNSQISKPEFETDYRLNRPINQTLRIFVLNLLTGRNNALDGVRWDFRLFYNLIPPLCALLALLFIDIKKRNGLDILINLTLFAYFGIVFLCAPGIRFMYYLPTYLSCYSLSANRLAFYMDKRTYITGKIIKN